MNNKLKTQAVEQLFQAILSLKDLDEAYDFFEDVCTINEILSLSQRFEVAKMLREQQDNIQEELLLFLEIMMFLILRLTNIQRMIYLLNGVRLTLISMLFMITF